MPRLDNPIPIHKQCLEHQKLEQQINDLKDDVDRNTAKLDRIIWLLAIVCVEIGITGVGSLV